MSLVATFYRRFEHLVHELAKFGSVGALAFAITMVLANVLHLGLHVGPLTSNAVATVIATTFAYFANRFWTFRHRDRSGLGREYTLFFALNGVGLVITQVFVGFVTYVLDLRGALPYNAALIFGTGAATLFRFWSYKKWVFLPVEAPAVDPHTGLPEGRPEPALASPQNGQATQNGQAVQNGQKAPNGQSGRQQSPQARPHLIPGFGDEYLDDYADAEAR